MLPAQRLIVGDMNRVIKRTVWLTVTFRTYPDKFTRDYVNCYTVCITLDCNRNTAQNTGGKIRKCAHVIRPLDHWAPITASASGFTIG